MATTMRLLIASALAVLAATAGACGSDDDGDDSTTPAAKKTGAAEVAFTGSSEEGLPTSYDEPKPKAVTLGLLNPLAANESVKATEDAAKRETERLGGKLIALDGKGDPNTQVTQAEQLIAQKVDGIAVPFPLDARALTPVLLRAQKAGIPVVGVDVSVGAPEALPGYTSQVWARRDETAYMQAKAAAAALGKGGEVAQIGFAVPVPTLEYGVERAQHWAEKFGLKVVGRVNNPSDDIAGGEKAMTELLSKYPDVGGVIGYNEQSVIGGASAARVQGLRDLTLIGANGGTLGIGAVDEGRITATVQPPYVSAAEQMVWGLYDAVENPDAKLPPVVLAPDKPKLVTGDTVDSVATFEEQLQEGYGS